MEPIRLEKGWLARELSDAQRAVEKWPESLKVLCSLNHPLSLGNAEPGVIARPDSSTQSPLPVRSPSADK